MDKLHPGARWLFRFGSYGGGLIFVFFLMFWTVMPAINIFNELGISLLWFFLPFFILIFLLVIFGEVYSRLAYNNWKYKFEDNALKLEHGIIWKKYSNIPYERVQNIDVTRGIIARMFGFSTVNIQTAGASYSPRGTLRGEGYIPAVSIKHAEDIRDFLVHKISKKSGGL
jgi:membrane protein YdbS with pleckstrin-like domain